MVPAYSQQGLDFDYLGVNGPLHFLFICYISQSEFRHSPGLVGQKAGCFCISKKVCNGTYIKTKSTVAWSTMSCPALKASCHPSYHSCHPKYQLCSCRSNGQFDRADSEIYDALGTSTTYSAASHCFERISGDSTKVPRAAQGDSN